ncbi:hypothetical protein D3C72_1457760 [compost metagenome]
MPRPPPVVMFRMALLRALMSGRNCANSLGSWSGRPVSGSRACRCSIAAPASAAATASSAICRGVIGRYGDIEGVWIEPVTAQVMMTFGDLRMLVSFWILAARLLAGASFDQYDLGRPSTFSAM